MFSILSNTKTLLKITLYLKKFTNNKRLGEINKSIKSGVQPVMFLRSPKHFKVGKQIVAKTYSKFLYTKKYKPFIKLENVLVYSNATFFYLLTKYISHPNIYGAIITKYKVFFTIKIKF